MRIRGAGPLALMLGTLVACGGGGDSSGGGGNGGGGNASHALQLSTAQITLSGPSAGLTAPIQTVSGTVTGNPSAIYATVTVESTHGISSVSSPIVTGASASLQITPKAPSTLAPGTYTDTITVRACPDPGCTTQFSGSPATVTFTYHVGLEVSSAAIDQTTVEGAPSTGAAFNLAFYAGNGNWTSGVSYASGSNWLSVPASGSTLPATFTPGFAAMAPGIYNATLQLGASANGLPTENRNIAVTYTVQPLLQIGAITNFSVTNAQGAAGQIRNAAVSSRAANRNTAWTASVLTATPWLQLTTASGTTGGSSTLALALDASALATMPNGRYTATVAIDPAEPTASTVTVPVVLDLDRSFVNTVAPYVAPSGRQLEVYLRGGQLDIGTVTEVRFGSVPAVTFTRDSATRIRATHPPLAAGRYPISVSINGAPIGSTAELVVQDAGNYAAAGRRQVAGPGLLLPYFPQVFEFDPERRACIYAMAGTTQNPSRLVRLRADAGSWSALVSPIDFESSGGITGATLSADGKILFVGAGDYLVHVDPLTLTEIRRVQIGQPGQSPVTHPGRYTRLDDGTLVFGTQNSGLAIYRPWDDSVTPLNTQSLVSGFYANRTGNKLLLAVTGGGGQNGYDVFDTHSRATTAGLRAYTYKQPVSDRFGERWAVTAPSGVDRLLIVSQDGSVLGETAGQRPDLERMLTADGRKLVAHVTGVNSQDLHRSYDLSALPTVTALGDVLTIYDYGPRYLTPTEDEVVTCGQEYISAGAAP